VNCEPYHLKIVIIVHCAALNAVTEDVEDKRRARVNSE
jgi:hypothetical protein